MGYRSSVGIAFSYKGYKAFRALLNNESPELQRKVKALLRRADISRIPEGTGDDAFFLWESIKWYPYFDDYEYEEIAFIENAVTDLESAPGISANYTDVLYIRLGEDNSDIAVIGEYTNNKAGMGLVRSITWH